MSESSGIKEEPLENNGQIVFKKKKRKNLRQRRDSDEAEEQTEANESTTLTTLEEIKLNQKLRERPKGVSLLGLALGKKLAPEEEIGIDNSFSKISGGLVNMQALKSGKLKEPDDAYDVGIGTQFSAETNKRDEDEEMMKYIEQELQKRKGKAENNGGAQETEESQKYLAPEEAALFAVPEHLRKSSSQRSEEMLSNQMLNGIPEVDLGIDAKIKNIEATEEAKQKLMRDQKNKKDGPSQFVPTNMAVNFTQHNRFTFGDNAEATKRFHNRDKECQEKQPNNSSTASGVKRATDDYHYDKFKKQFRRF